MSVPTVLPPRPSSSTRQHPDDETLARYSAISRAALLALFLGLASALVLVSPLLVIVPLAAAAIAIVALRQIATSGGQYTGRWSATAGLCLAMLFAGWGLSRQWTREAVLQEQARHFAEDWLKLVRAGHLQRAHQYFLSASSRLSSDEAIAEYYKTEKEAGEMMKSMFASEPMKSVSSMRDRGSVEFRSAIGQWQRGFIDDVVVQFAVRSPESGEEKPLWITVTRTVDGGSKRSGWQISRASGDPPP